MKQLHYACTELRDKNEIAIIYKYGCDAKRYSTILTSKFIRYFNIIPKYIPFDAFHINSLSNKLQLTILILYLHLQNMLHLLHLFNCF